MISRILVPLDGSELAEGAIPLAVDLARRYGAELILVRTTQVPDLAVDVTTIPVASLEELRREEVQGMRSYLESWQARIAGDGVSCRIVTRVDAAAEGILAQAAEDDVSLIAMSTHGRSGFQRWVQGSVAERVARGAPCPVLLVRPARR